MDYRLDRRTRNGGFQMRSNWDKSALNKVCEVYTDLSLRPIERNCVRVKECCHFKLTGRTPYLTKGEAMVAAKALRATGRTQLPENATGACPLLDSGH